MKTLFFLLFSIICLNTQAQDWSTDNYKYNELYPGYIITADGERTSGYLKYRNRYVMQSEIIFYRSKEDLRSKKKYSPEDLIEYGVADKVYHCINYTGSALTSGKRAVLLVNDGCISQYTWYERADGYNHLLQGSGESDEDFAKRKYPETTVIYKKGDDIAVEIDFFKEKFPKKMASYVSDNKELATKVKSKQSGYNFIGIKGIIKESKL